MGYYDVSTEPAPSIFRDNLLPIFRRSLSSDYSKPIPRVKEVTPSERQYLITNQHGVIYKTTLILTNIL